MELLQSETLATSDSIQSSLTIPFNSVSISIFSKYFGMSSSRSFINGFINTRSNCLHNQLPSVSFYSDLIVSTAYSINCKMLLRRSLTPYLLIGLPKLHQIHLNPILISCRVSLYLINEFKSKNIDHLVQSAGTNRRSMNVSRFGQRAKSDAYGPIMNDVCRGKSLRSSCTAQCIAG